MKYCRLVQRNFSCGVEAQRDLYSAYLARFVRAGSLNAAGAAEHWQSGESLLRTAFERIQVANRGPLPASFGLKNRKQSVLYHKTSHVVPNNVFLEESFP